MEGMSVILAVQEMSSFTQSPPAGWRYNPTLKKTICEDGSVTVLTSDKTFDGRNSCLEVSTLVELENLKLLISSKPIVTTATCTKDYPSERRYDEDGGENDETDPYNKLEEEYVVIVNTLHPEMIDQFNKAFSKADDYLREGKKFRITIDLSESLKVWFRNHVHIKGQTNSVAWGCNLYIACGAHAPTFADNCFSCEAATMKFFWCICFPFFLLCFVPYAVYKKFIVGIHEEKISRPICVTYHKGPFQIGFNIFNLLYPPGTTFTTINTTYNQPYIQQPHPYAMPNIQSNAQPLQPMGYTQQPPMSYQVQPGGYQQPMQYQGPPQEHTKLL